MLVTTEQKYIYAILCVLLAGCSTTGRVISVEDNAGQGVTVQPAYRAEPGNNVSRPAVLEQLYAHYQQWRGTPWQLGGNSRAGMDCSAFTQQVYAQQFRRQLPRTTAQQQRQGRTIAEADLQPGDLVFFRLGPGRRHVGIYLENGRFMHVSTRVGVTISKLSSPWWRSAYWKSTRP